MQFCDQKGGLAVEFTGIGFSGQMHNQRSQRQIHSIHKKIQKEEVGRQTLNALSPVFFTTFFNVDKRP
ncbi:hypothetical protein [Neobacillus sp. 204]|uniref:hypothetical protein n=1 Tax=Neobacillus sp. 204 TaxID=3383351 RepID=UPI00397AFB6F